MPRIGKCPCGATLRIPDNPPPDGVKCAACGRVLKVRPKQAPAPGQPARAAEAGRGAACPQCGEAVEPGSLICVHCGLNLADGSVAATKIEEEEKVGEGFLYELKTEFVSKLKKWWWVFVGLGLLGLLVWQI